MSFSAPNQRFCEVNLSFGLSRRNFMSLVKTSRARQSLMEPRQCLQKSYRGGKEKPAGGGYLPRATTVLSAGAHLELVLRRSAGLMDMQITSEGFTEIAGRSRGTPRIANRLLRRVRDWALVNGVDRINATDAATALDMYEVDSRGLDRLDRAVLEALIHKFGGGPVGLSTLAIAVGEETETVETVAEPYLVREGLIGRTPRGRVALPAAWEHLGLEAPEIQL